MPQMPAVQWDRPAEGPQHIALEQITRLSTRGSCAVFIPNADPHPRVELPG